MKTPIIFCLCALALAWSIPGHSQVSPAPEAASAVTTTSTNAASTGVTGNDGSAPQSDGADSRSDKASTPDYQERKPTGKETGDKDDFSGNEGTDTESTGTGTGHGTAGKDRKSTRLNSSHVRISYAVFCLKKKNNKSTG